MRRIGLDEEELVQDYLGNIYNMIILKDVIEREQIRNVYLLQTLLHYVADCTGKQFSARSISNFLKSQNLSASPNVILGYLNFLCNAYIINKVPRYDIHGKHLFELGDKYYFEDIGIRNCIAGGNRVSDIEKVIENVVYLHLKRLGFTVYVGLFQKAEIDFVAIRPGQTIYVQVTYQLSSEETIQREFGNLQLIKDNYPKYVVSMDEFIGVTNDAGIHHIPLRQFLMMSTL